MSAFGQKLKAQRELRSLTQIELARACGVSQSLIVKYESGTRKKPSFDFVRKAAIILEIPISELADSPTHEEWSKASKLREGSSEYGSEPFNAREVRRMYRVGSVDDKHRIESGIYTIFGNDKNKSKEILAWLKS